MHWPTVGMVVNAHRSTEKLEAGKICRVSSKLFFWSDVHTGATSGSDTYVFNDGAQTAAIVESNGLTTKQTSFIPCLWLQM
jgi:hypothetical protein